MTAPGKPHVWAAPVIIACLMTGSLLAALLGDNVQDALACIVLASVLVYAALRSVRRDGSAEP